MAPACRQESRILLACSHSGTGGKLEVEITNRQRKVIVNLTEWQLTFEQLAAALCKNIEDRPPEIIFEPVAVASRLRDSGLIHLTFSSNKSIKEVNKKWREKDSATDVLSFPLHDLSAPIGPLLFGDHLELGDIIISIEKAQEQADNFGHSLKREIAFLFVHGTLHLLGFDHETPEDEKEMFGRQNEILDACGISR